MSPSRVLVVISLPEVAESLSQALFCRGFAPHASSLDDKVVLDLGLSVLDGWKATSHVEPSDLPNRPCVVAAREGGLRLMEAFAPNGLSAALQSLAN